MKTFIKKNKTNFTDALHAEYKGLLQLQKLLDKVSELKTPEIINISQNALEIEFIQNSSPTSEQMKQLGIGLASIHEYSFELYGLSYDNYIGLNPQFNGINTNWGNFFVEKRLLSQISMIKNQELQKQFQESILKHTSRLKSFLNDTTVHPSLIHGDLWNGNVMFSNTDIYLIDPAIYFADREVDIAMTEIFGGFTQDFYTAYDAQYPLHKEYERKKEIYNLYHYLNHYNLFGDAYLSDCISRFELIEKL